MTMLTEKYLLGADSVAINLRVGRQTQHRVPMKPQPSIGDGGVWYPEAPSQPAHRSRHYAHEAHFRTGVVLDFAPWGVGTALYVREAWTPVDLLADHVEREEPVCIGYRADKMAFRHEGTPGLLLDTGGWNWDVRWRPSIHMEKWMARTWLKVKRVWVEQVQDISEEDARAEGIELPMYAPKPGDHPRRGLCANCKRPWIQHAGSASCCPGVEGGQTWSRRSACGGFAYLWNSLYPGSWERNDWVWACELELDRERSGLSS